MSHGNKQRFFSIWMIALLILSMTLPFIPVQSVSAEEANTNDNRTVKLTYERADGNYQDWDVWVWNTGVKEDNIDFTAFEDGLTTATIEVAPSTKQIGFIIRKDGWVDREPNGQEMDRNIAINQQDSVTKVHVKQGEVDFHIVPGIPEPKVENGTATFYYRDKYLYVNDQMDTIDKVELQINDQTFEMTYEDANERYVYEYDDFPEGEFPYAFLVTKAGETKEVTDPYYEKSTIENVSLDLEVTGNVEPAAITSDENAVLTLTITGEEASHIREMYADVTALGGPKKLAIDPQLNEVTFSVKNDVPAGEKVIPLTVIDDFGGIHQGSVTVEVKTKQEVGESNFDWDEAVIYFMLTDRFFDGDPSNNNPYNMSYDTSKSGTYHGGDFKGITEKLDYLDDLGVNTIWISPVVENIKYDVRHNATDHPGESYYGYHGYWGSDFTQLNPHFGTMEDFHKLIDEAANRNMKIMVDVVLNHTGYGLKEIDGQLEESKRPNGYPTDAEREKFRNLVRQGSNVGSDEVTGELAGLPDFITEDPEVRQQIIDWQTDWIEKSRTANGNAISYFRVDTVKHVEPATWQAFKNELTKKDPGFKLIGEAWGASQDYDFGYLRTGQMDGLLDFGFKGIAKDFVNGNVDEANKRLESRNSKLDNTATLGQFLGSHDEDGFLYSVGGDVGKLKVAASLQMTAKGQPVIYYGEELGLTGENNYPYYANRYDMDWDQIEDNDVLKHYRKILAFRGEHSKVFARGERNKIAGSNQDKFLIFKQTYQDDSVYTGLNLSENAKEITLEVTSDEAVITDRYAGKTYAATDGTVTVSIPAMADGGTALFTVAGGKIVGVTESENIDPIPDQTLRVHYERADQNYAGLGLWVWEDVAVKSEDNGSWPDGATPFIEKNGAAYVDIKLAEGAKTVGMLVNNKAGANLTGDIMVDILSPAMNELWLSETGEVSLYKPVDLGENKVRIHYLRDDANYDPWGLWTWGDVAKPTENWPMGAHAFSNGQVGQYGAYVDVDLNEAAKEIGLIVLERRDGGSQTGDMLFKGLDKHRQLFLREGDETIYTNPYYVAEEGMIFAELVALDKIEIKFTSTEDYTNQQLTDGIVIEDRNGNNVPFDNAEKADDGKTVSIYGAFSVEQAPYTITFENRQVVANRSWKLVDNLYRYEGDLGAQYNKDGTATLRVWSPSADNVSVIVYDKDDPTKVIAADVKMTKGDRGVWEVTLNKNNTGKSDVKGYYYHYEIERNGEKVIALDPYAKSLGAWNADTRDELRFAKAAIVDPSSIGPELDYAKIDGFEKREDAIIYEVHVRDFTSDPSIGDELNAQFGTFSAFTEKLDYLEELGVTHIQLLPVMSYYFTNEYKNGERLLDYASENTNYNWGYDPQSYFSLTGMYSENPEDPEKRIAEFKQLIDAIHQRGMGVILDVVYNHTADVNLFENLEPNYYHFMDADGTPRTSFGGGRLGTTHKMAQRVLVDSITYWTDEFKVDGFRFDMMGDHDAETIQLAYDKAKDLNPNIVMIGEGWRTFAGDENGQDVMPADQDWMQHTESVGSFSDDLRNELKSGFGSEGQPRFLTGGARNIQHIFDNLTANPHNFKATNPGDVVSYIAAHDNLTLHDVIAQSIKKDPKDHEQEIHERIRLGNTMLLTAQGTAFMHAGQEYGRTKQFRHEDYKLPVDNPPYKSTYMADENGNPFEYPYFIHDSYDSSDAVNKFDWEKVTNAQQYPIQQLTKEYTKGLIQLRRSTDAFRLGTMDEIASNVSMIEAPEIAKDDLVIGYRAESTDNMRTYYVFINADQQTRTLTLSEDLMEGIVIVDKDEAGIKEVFNPNGFALTSNQITLDPLTAVVVMVGGEDSDDNDDGGDGDGNGKGNGKGNGNGNGNGKGNGKGNGNGNSNGKGSGNNNGNNKRKGN